MDRYMKQTEDLTVRSDNAMESEVQKKYDTIMWSLIHSGHSVTAMESCTGGMIASLLTDTEGASGILKGTYVTYSNEAKIACGVSEHVIQEYGVYSIQTAEAMAKAARIAYHADLGIGITGSFGNVDPVNSDSIPGEIYAAVSFLDSIVSEQFVLPLGLARHTYKLLAANHTADLILHVLADCGITESDKNGTATDCAEGK